MYKPSIHLQRCIELPAQTKVIKEERDVLKRELSNAMLQLANTSHTKEIERLVEERDLLRNAVVQQQEYSKSLQKHYENWANEAAKKMKEEIMVARNSPKRQIIMENFYSQNSPNQRDTSEEIRNLKASTMEERNNFEAEKLKLTENIKKLEKLLSNRGGEVSTIATQTYEEIALYENLPQQYTSNKMPIMNSNNDFVQHEDLLNESDSDLVLLTEEKFQLMQENTHQAELISELESRLQNWSSIGKPLLEDSGTQTSHDEELLPFPTKTSQLLEDSTTQTEHDNETVGHNEGETILKEKYLELQRENYVLRLEVQQLEKLGHDALNNQMLEDSGTQTDHDNYAATSHVSILLEDSSTQTDHDDELVGSFHQDMFLLQSREEDVVQLTVKLKEALQQNEALAAIISKHESNNAKAQSDVGTQTRHDDEPVRRFPNEADVLKTSVTDSSTQTDHDLEPLHSTQSVAYTGDSDTGQDIDVKHDMSSVCQSCGSAASNTQSNRPPSPMTILKTMESQKLKAYKNTVHILKRKLKRAEDTISNQQAELKVLMPVNSEDLTTAGTDNHDVSCNTSREADVAGKKGKSQEDINQMQREIYELKRTSALQAEEMRRKHLAGKKILEAKVLKLNERITRLTETNELMRNSFDTLQVKLTEKKMALDIVQKEKNRFKTRARRLQASLRSLAWITGKQEKTLLAEIDDGVVDFSINESAEDSFGLENQSVYSTDSADGEHQCKENRFSISLPASVIDVEESLKDLQSEIVALEKQMQEHNTAVKKSKTQWGRLKEESTKELLPQNMSRSKENTHKVEENLFSDVNTKIV